MELELLDNFSFTLNFDSNHQCGITKLTNFDVYVTLFFALEN